MCNNVLDDTVNDNKEILSKDNIKKVEKIDFDYSQFNADEVAKIDEWFSYRKKNFKKLSSSPQALNLQHKYLLEVKNNIKSLNHSIAKDLITAIDFAIANEWQNVKLDYLISQNKFNQQIKAEPNKESNKEEWLNWKYQDNYNVEELKLEMERNFYKIDDIDNGTIYQKALDKQKNLYKLKMELPRYNRELFVNFLGESHVSLLEQ